MSYLIFFKDIVSTYLKGQYAKDEWGMSVTGEIHHQQNNLLNINHFSNTEADMLEHIHVEPVKQTLFF